MIGWLLAALILISGVFMKSHRFCGHLAALFTMLIWGTTFISTKVLLRSFDPVAILSYRFVLGYLVLVLMHFRPLKFQGCKTELLFAGAGLCGVTLYYLLENMALTYTLSSNVSIIVSTAPIFTGLLAHWLLKGEKLRPRFFLGFFCAISGIALISLGTQLLLQINPRGDLLSVLAAIVWAFYSIFIKKISELGLHPLEYTRRVFFYGILMMIPIVLKMGVGFEVQQLLQPVNLLNLLYLGCCASAVCFVAWNYAVSRLGAVKASIYIYGIPAVTILFSWLILREPLSLASLAGAGLTLAGMLLSSHGNKNAPSKSK
jgi:drug/metabolite transporter (DMT)-like permease